MPDVSTPTLHERQASAVFGPSEWGMSLALAVMWGSSFLWIAIAIDHLPVTVVPLARCGFGAAALACVPAARRRIDRADVPRFAVLGVIWMALPFLLYPIAERTVSSSIAGMINGGLPVVTTVVTALFVRQRPSARRMLAVAIGASGIALISLASLDDGTDADVRGIVLLLVAVLSYAIAANVARPVQARYGALPSMLWIEVFGVAWSVPMGVHGLARSSFSWEAFGALLMLGAMGTGIAFAVYATLLHRAGPVRGMIGIFFTPIIGLVLGVTVRDEALHPLALAGMCVVIVGAVLTSRPETPTP